MDRPGAEYRSVLIGGPGVHNHTAIHTDNMAVLIEDSNIAWLGSDLELKVRKAAAEQEGAFEGAGQKEGLRVWRVENFALKLWPEEKYGTFYSGDSFIVLRTFKKGDSQAFSYDISFWLGKYTSQDEMGVAAYKTVELDDFLGTIPVQYREVQEHESEHFLTQFAKMRILDGGIDSGFNVVKPEEYQPRLLHVKGKRGNVRVSQVELKSSSMNQGDVFILDHGLKVFQWNGSESGVFERRKASEVVADLKDERLGKASSTILDGLEEEEAFWGLLGSMDDVKSAGEGGEDEAVTVFAKKLFQLSDESGSLELTVKDDDGVLSRKDLLTSDVFLVDLGASIYVWVGAGASKAEKAKGMKYATDYLLKEGRPMYTPVMRVVEGGETDAFWRCFDE